MALHKYMKHLWRALIVILQSVAYRRRMGTITTVRAMAPPDTAGATRSTWHVGLTAVHCSLSTPDDVQTASTSGRRIHEYTYLTCMYVCGVRSNERDERGAACLSV